MRRPQSGGLVQRVAFLSSEYPPHTHGGLGTAVEALSRALGAGGRDVVVCVPDAAHYAAPPAGVSLIRVPVVGAVTDLDFWLTWCEGAAEALAAVAPPIDVVHGHDWMAVPAAVAVARAKRVPAVMTVHLPQAAPGTRALEDVGIAACDAVVVNSDAVRAELARRGLRDAGVVVVPNGVDLERFRPTAEPADPHRVLFVGRLVPQKGADVLIRAFGALLRRHADATLTVAGDGEQRLYLERLARFLGVRQSVEFLGWQRLERLPPLYRSAAVTAVPSLYEPFGLVALEAMASGRPVVAARTGGLTEVVEDGTCGFTVEPGDHLDLASRLATVLTDAGLAARLGAAARLRAERFGWAVAAARTAEVYETAAAAGGRNAAVAGASPAVGRLLAPVDDDAIRRRMAALVGADSSVAPSLEPSDPLGGPDGR